MKSIRVGFDLAKRVFQVHGVGRDERPILKKRLSRGTWIEELVKLMEPGCVVGMEACTGAHYWARALQRRGFTVKLMARQFVKPFVRLRMASSIRWNTPHCGPIPTLPM